MRTAIIGAGASGMVAAVTAARYGAEVTLFEKNERVGKKILSTGNGKCNLGNLAFSMEQYYCNDMEKLRKMFQVFSVWDAMTFFESMGLMIKDKNGYLYPYSEQASAVLDILRMELNRTGVKVKTETEIIWAKYHKEEETFELKDLQGNLYRFDRIVVACGSPASLKKGEGMTGYELAKLFGHQIVPLAPGLVQLRSDDGFIRALAGVRCQADVKLLIDEQEAASEKGELQFTEYGVSGIPIFQFSRLASYAIARKCVVKIMIDFFPEQEEKVFTYMSRLRYEAQMDKKLEDYLTGTLHKKINMVMLKQAGLKPQIKAREVGLKKIDALMQQYRSFIIHISGVNSLQNAQVCAGGVSLEQVSTELESELVKGLYFAGEILDIDGKCGGYNLQWAWSSGYIAGRNAAGDSTRELDKENKEPSTQETS